MTTYADSLTLREARSRLFAANAGTFGPDGGYDTTWIRIEFGPVPLFLPNTAGRKAAVGRHDLHHIATGYQTDLVGESEIGAWEVGSGCRTYYHAWVLNLWAFTMGLVIAPRRTFRAYVRGSCCGTLYDSPYDDSLLDETVGAMRTRLRLKDAPPTPGVREIMGFIFWSAVSVLTSVVGAVPAVAIGVVASIIILGRKLVRA